jgi:hypothetical protein
MRRAEPLEDADLPPVRPAGFAAGTPLLTADGLKRIECSLYDILAAYFGEIGSVIRPAAASQECPGPPSPDHTGAGR